MFLGKGLSASTYKAIYESKNVCVKTLHPTLDKENVANFSKEAEILQRINISHVVKLIAVSDNPITIMMEFCAFSFTPFNRDATFNSLDEYLSYYEKEDLHCFFPTILHKISSDTTKAVQYIRSNNIVHRDIKPANILVNNMHYNNLTNVQETAKSAKSEPIICKLADLGQARSKLLKTRVISNNSCTHFVRPVRPSPAYMAPEMLVAESILKSVGIEQLKTIDVWALVTTFFVILNPDQKNPFQFDLEKRRACDAGLNVSDALLYFLRKKAMPSFSQKYEEIQATCYSKLRYVFFKYLEFDALERAIVNEVIENLT